MEENIFDTELGRKVLALTKASFKVADLITDHIVREKIKHRILNIYEIFSVFGEERNYSELLKEIDVLDNLFCLSGHLNLMKDDYVKALRNGLLVFKSHIILANSEKRHKIFENTEKLNRNEQTPAAQKSKGFLSLRQEKILEKFPDKNTSLKLVDFVAIFPGLSKRTVRNDLAYLIKTGKISRQGQGSSTTYKLN